MLSKGRIATRVVILWTLLLGLGSSTEQGFEPKAKSLKICSVSGGLDITRLKSSLLRNVFLGALEDVEFIREYIAEAAVNGGIVGGLHDLDQMSNSLDWAGRNMSSSATTLSAGLGYVDDRRDRRVDRYVGTINEPYVGSKALDMALIDSASNIFPWLVDRRSDEAKWWLPHQNGRLIQNVVASSKMDRLYVAAWMGTKGEAWMYYPPFVKTVGNPNMPFGTGDIVAPAYDSTEERFINPNLPENNPEKNSYFTKPYSDTAVPGLSLITAQAPIYFTGDFRGESYSDTYIASAGVDISMASISSFLEELEGRLTKNSFAFVVDSRSFDMVIISQSTVQKIYPARTGFEEARVSYSKVDGSIVSDRRNQTYLPSDTLFQSPIALQNANWDALAREVRNAAKGRRAWSNINITINGDNEATEFYAMYESWNAEAGHPQWTLITFSPVEEVETAMSVQIDMPNLDLTVKRGESVTAQALISNNGTLDAAIKIDQMPSWLTVLTEIGDQRTLAAGESLLLEFELRSNNLNQPQSSISSFIAITVLDDDYPDCFYHNVLSVVVNVKIQGLDDLSTIRPYGLLLSAIVMASSIGWSLWVSKNRSFRVVRASQPVFLHMMCVGIFLMGASIIPMAIDDSIASDRACSVACMATPWLLAMGFSITFSALFSKIWRINQIVEACLNLKKVKVSTRDVMIPFLIIFSLNTLVLTLWSIISPFVWIRAEFGEQGSENGYCSMNGNTSSIVFAVLIIVLNFLALVLASVQLYKARALSTEYSEGKYIAIAIGSMVQAFLTGLPLLVLVQQNAHATYFLKSTIVFVVATSLLLLTFFPKYSIAILERNNEVYPPRTITTGASTSLTRTGNPLRGSSEENESTSDSSLFEDAPSDQGLGDTARNADPASVPYNSVLRAPRKPLISDLTDSLFTISENEVISMYDEDVMAMIEDEVPDADQGPPLWTTKSMLDVPNVRSVFALHGPSRRQDGSPRVPRRGNDVALEAPRRREDSGIEHEAQENGSPSDMGDVTLV